MISVEIKEEREKKGKKKRKRLQHQTRASLATHVTSSWRRRQEDSNSAVEGDFLLPNGTTRVTRTT
jgi:hypothetical protein